MLTRRKALQLGISSALSAQAIASAAPASLLDCHTHFYDPTRPKGVPWPGKESPLYRPVYPKDWHRLAAPHGIHETVVVEASKLVQDNDWILNLAATDKRIIGFIGHLQPAEDGFTVNLKRLAANPLFRGIRLSGGTLLADWDKPQLTAALKLLSDLDLTLDLNGLREPSLVARIAAALPLRLMIDHCGNCGDPQQLQADWKAGMAAAAKYPQVFCKVSALPEMASTPAGQAPVDTAYYAPILDHLWQHFGEDKVVFGSNWPVSDKGTNFANVFKIVDGYISAKGQLARQKYFRQNGLAAYKVTSRQD
jgi:predicted TIM-barrel fold metal-dependent hydrolase